MKYQNFFIEELFRLEKGKVSNAQALKEGDEIGYVGAKYNNNGVIKYCLREDSKVTKGNCIVFICDGEGSMGLSFYKSDDFMGTVNVTAGYNDNLTPNIGLYISTVANTVRGKYNFGYKRKFDRLKRETLSLPVDDSGQPDWKFMEEYIQIKKDQIKATYQFPVQHQITDFRELNEVEWNEFFISDYFDVNKERGSESNMDSLREGNLPLISARKFGNGLKGFVETEPRKIKSSNVITWNKDGDGGAGLAYYQEFKFAVDSHVFVLYAKFPANKYNQLFIVTLLSKYKEVFNHGRANSLSRYKAEKIMLPSKGGLPDFSFMEQYMKRMENRVIEKVAK